MNIYIYLLKDLHTPIYVGASVRPQERLKNHMRGLLKDHRNKDAISMEILEVCEKRNIGGKERQWIAKYKKINPHLLNKTESSHSGKCGNAEWVNIKMSSVILNKLRKNKKKTGVTIMSFVHQAVTEKLSK